MSDQVQEDAENTSRGYIFKGSDKWITFKKAQQFTGKWALDNTRKIVLYFSLPW